MGFCAMVVAFILLHPGGVLPDHKLNHYLSRLNSDKNTGRESTAVTLKRMVAQGYIRKVTETNESDETIDWVVMPRGKIEIGTRGVQGIVREVYAEDAPSDLDKRLQRSLGTEIKKININEENEEASGDEAPANGDPGPSNTRTNGRRRRAADDD